MHSKIRGDYEPMLFNLPDEMLERWRVIRRFVGSWYGVSLPTVGGQAARIRQIEDNLGYPLPPSVREWIALIYDLIDADAFGLMFRDALGFSEIQGTDAVSLLIQGEGDYHWGVKKEDLGTDDPPVYGYQIDWGAWEGGEAEFEENMRWSPRLTTWAIRFILTYLYIGSESFGARVDDFSALFPRLCAAFPHHQRLDDDEIFEAKNLIAVLSRSFGPGGGPYLQVFACKSVPREEIPDVVRECARNGGWFSNLFAPK